MGFLNKLWDETLAGPAPDSGLGRLRKYNSFSAVRSSPPVSLDDVPISRTITLKTNSTFRNYSPCDPASPAGSSTPSSPFSPVTPPGEFKKLRRKKKLVAEPMSVHDWIVMSILDR